MLFIIIVITVIVGGEGLIHSSSGIINITTQSRLVNYVCPNQTECTYNCNFPGYAPCLRTNFTCGMESTCIINCLSRLSCSFSVVQCDPTSIVKVNCIAYGSCSYIYNYSCVVDFNNSEISGNIEGKRGHTFQTSVGLTIVEAFGRSNVTILNTRLLPDTSVQAFTFDLPTDKKSLTNLFDQVYKDIYLITNETGDSLKGYNDYSFTLTRTHPYIVVFTTDRVLQVIKTSINNFIGNQESLTIASVELLPNTTMVVGVLVTSANPIIEFIIPLLDYLVTPVTKEYVSTLIDYPPEVLTVFTVLNRTQPDFFFYIYVSGPFFNCTYPAPFQDQIYCNYSTWMSYGNTTIDLSNLIATSAEQNGSVVVQHSPLIISNGAYKVRDSLTVTSSISVINESAIHVAQLSVVNLELETSSRFTAKAVEIGPDSELKLHLSVSDLQTLNKTGIVSLTLFNNCSSLQGDFSNISVMNINPNDYCTEKNLAKNFGITIFSPCPKTGTSLMCILPVSLSISIVVLIIAVGGTLYYLSREKSLSNLDVDLTKQNPTRGL